MAGGAPLRAPRERGAPYPPAAGQGDRGAAEGTAPPQQRGHRRHFVEPRGRALGGAPAPRPQAGRPHRGSRAGLCRAGAASVGAGGVGAEARL